MRHVMSCTIPTSFNIVQQAQDKGVGMTELRRKHQSIMSSLDSVEAEMGDSVKGWVKIVLIDHFCLDISNVTRPGGKKTEQLDGILESHDVTLDGAVHEFDHRREGGRLA